MRDDSRYSVFTTSLRLLQFAFMLSLRISYKLPHMNMSCLLSYILWEDRNMVSEVRFWSYSERSHDDRMADSNLPLPMAMNMKGDVASNWKFFKDQWQNNDIASGLAQKEANVRLTTLKVVIGKDCYEILQRLPDSENKTTVEETLTALEQYFIPKRNVAYERFVFNNCHQGTHETVNMRLNSAVWVRHASLVLWLMI